MAQTTPVPDAWAGQEVHVRYVDADAPRSLDCTIREVNARGVCVAAGDRTGKHEGHREPGEDRRGARERGHLKMRFRAIVGDRVREVRFECAAG